jgi:hypothetical protein
LSRMRSRMLERFALVKFMVASITIGRDGKTLAFGAMIRATKLRRRWHRKGEPAAGKGFWPESKAQAGQEYFGLQRHGASKDRDRQQDAEGDADAS